MLDNMQSRIIRKLRKAEATGSAELRAQADREYEAYIGISVAVSHYREVRTQGLG